MDFHARIFFLNLCLQAESEDSPVVPPCSSCTSLGRSISYLVHCGTYSHYLKTGSPAPDLVLAQNCGFSEFQVKRRISFCLNFLLTSRPQRTVASGLRVGRGWEPCYR